MLHGGIGFFSFLREGFWGLGQFRIDRRQRKIQTAKEAMETSEGDGSGSFPRDEERKKMDLGGEELIQIPVGI